MKPQRYEKTSSEIRGAFERLRTEHPERLARRMDVSFCSDCFGLEYVVDSVERLARLGYSYIEIGGNYGGPDSGNQTQLEQIREALAAFQMRCSGIAPTDSPALALTTQEYFQKQQVKEHIRGNARFCRDVGGTYCLQTAGPCGTDRPMDAGDWDRSVMLLRESADCFTEYGIRCAIEPIHPIYTPICHTVVDAKRYINEVRHPGVRHIYGDLQHLLAGEAHVGQAILDCGEQLLCLHIRDTQSNLPVGNGMMDLDTVIRALYLIGFNTDGHYVVGEVDPGAYLPGVGAFNFGIRYSEDARTAMARETLEYFREREEEVLAAPPLHCG